MTAIDASAMILEISSKVRNFLQNAGAVGID